MKAVTKYEANDGSVWGTESAAIMRDILICDVAEELARLKVRARQVAL